MYDLSKLELIGSNEFGNWFNIPELKTTLLFKFGTPDSEKQAIIKKTFQRFNYKKGG